jgi:lipopolysaccharide/colanic/teichoic acid biosynthesis glycosyltransferase
MAFYNPLRFFISPDNAKGVFSTSEILSKEAFRRVLERERARTDRYGDMFSLVVFEKGNAIKRRIKKLPLAEILVKRIRPTDVVGWFQKAQLGVVLPNTASVGAQKLAEDICREFWVQQQQRPAYKIYTYPIDKLNKISKELHNLVFKDDECIVTELPVNQKQAIAVGDCKRLARNLETLFGEKCPAWKRTLDIFGAGFGLILFFPLFAAIAIILKLVSKGPVFFRQERVGHLGKPFTMLKFRTMKVDADISIHENHVTDLIQNGKPLKKMDCHDSRIFPFGKFLRMTGLDELPQFINVLKGEMSLIGPRPELSCSIRYCEPWHSQRFETKPGLSGLWQVSDRTARTFNEMMRLDISYVKKMSFWLDAVIILKTFPAIIQQMNEHAR